jgi:predicted metalloendopeptidase
MVMKRLVYVVCGGLGCALAVLNAGWADDDTSKTRRSGIDKQHFKKSVKPGDDFYVYVNGTWLDEFEIPADKSNYGSFTGLADDAEKALRKIVEATAARQGKTKGSDDQKVGDFYTSYMDLARRNREGIRPVQWLLDEIDALEDKQKLSIWMGRVGARHVSNPFRSFVSPDAKNSSQYIVYLSQGGISLPDRDYYLSDDEQYQKIRATYSKYLLDLLAEAQHDNPQRAAERILALETKFAEAHWTKVKNRDPNLTYNRRSSDEIAKLMPTFDWVGYANAAGIGKQEQFVIRQPSYLETFGKLFAETPLDVWKDYYFYRTINSYAPLLGDKFDALRFGFYQTTLRGVTEQQPQWKRAIQMMNGVLGELLGKIYVREYFKPQAKERMAELVDNLKLALAKRIDDLEWMSIGTKRAALQKLAKFTTKIGYPDEWEDYTKLEIEAGDLIGNLIRASEFQYNDMLDKLGGPIDRGEWHMTPQTVNAYYNPVMNEIVFPAAILQPPFFNLEADDAVNYGAIGAVIGHELSHGFDDKGSQYDGDGNLRNWWTKEDRDEFDRRAAELVKQYGEFSPVDGMTVNGRLTLGENIGDLGGINTAYTAYLLSLDGKTPPVIDGYTGPQRFFMGWGQIWRRKYREEELRRRLLTDPHSPSQYRCNGILANMDAFYEAFNVPKDSEMYISPEKRVRIW